MKDILQAVATVTITLFVAILIWLTVKHIIVGSDTKSYNIYWIEKDEAGSEGRMRHNGVLTDSGYLFTDTIYSHKLNKKVVHTTWVQIVQSK